MPKKAVIVVSLVEESAEKPNEEIEKEIMEELSREPARIPWMQEVEKVRLRKPRKRLSLHPYDVKGGYLRRRKENRLLTEPRKT